MLTRLRGWLVYRGYSQEVGPDCQQRFGRDADGVVWWDFRVPVGAGRAVPLRFGVRLLEGCNAVEVELLREAAGGGLASIPDDNPVRLILRPDVEDRSAHAKTKAFAGPEEAWARAVHRHRSLARRYPDRYQLLRFEDLVAAPEATLEGLCGFLGIVAEPRMLEQQVTSRGALLGTAGFDGDRQSRDCRCGFYQRVYYHGRQAGRGARRVAAG